MSAKRNTQIEREDAIAFLQSGEVGLGNLDDQTNEQLADEIDNFMNADDTKSDMEFEDAEAQATFSNLVEIYEAGDTIAVIGDAPEEEEESPKKKAVAKKTAPKAAAKKTAKKTAPAKEEKAAESAPTKSAKKTVAAKKAAVKTPPAKKAPAPKKKAPAPKKKVADALGRKLGKLSAINAAYQLLKEVKRIMTAGEIIDELAKRKMWKSDTSTPAATLASKLIMECVNDGDKSRFERPDRGLFKIRGMKCPARVVEKAEPAPKPKAAAKKTKPAAAAAKKAPVKKGAKKAAAKK